MADSPKVQQIPLILEVSHECRLIGADDQVLAALRRELTIDNPKYQAAKQFGRWIGKQLKPQLFFFREEAGALVFPRGFGNQAVRICRQFTGSAPLVQDKRCVSAEIELRFQGELRPYQQQAVDAVTSRSFGVLEAGTGSGKTIMALAVIAHRRQPTLILVHSKELMYQWQERIRTFLGMEAGLAGDGRLQIEQLTVAIVNTAKKHLATLPPQFGQIVVDECHRVPASLFTEVVAAFDCRYMLGLSATAFRREDGMTRLIYMTMGERVHRVDSRVLETSGAVLRPKFDQRSTGFFYAYQGEYATLIKALTKDRGRNLQIVEDVCARLASEHAGTVLVVSDRVEHCQTLAESLLSRSVPVAVLSGRTPPEERFRVV